jgi:Zn-dependent protease with chaperone function
MNFYKAQDDAHRKTKILIFYYAGAILATGIAMHFAMSLIRVHLLARFTKEKILFRDALSDWNGLALVVGVTYAVIVLGSLYKRLQVSSGGSVVAQSLGGTLIAPDTRDPEERQLLNVVEEMAIASGMPVPQVWVMDADRGINAFAAGTEPGNAVIGVTRGTIQGLNRAELQGVVAHEFSHILNGDMKMNIRLLCMLHGLLLITLIGYGLFRFGLNSGNSGKKKENSGLPIAIIGAAIIAVGTVGAFFASLIQAAISRQREYLADASAVEFTMDPSGISGALKKIGGTALRGYVSSSNASEMEHMFFASSGIFNYGFASHPPLEERIKIIEPSWNGEFPIASKRSFEERQEMWNQNSSKPVTRNPMDILSNGIAASALLNDIGDSSKMKVQQGHVIISGLERSWIDACHDKYHAQLLIYGMLMADEKSVRDQERKHLQAHVGTELSDQVLFWKGQMKHAESTQKIAMLDLCIPTLRMLAREEYQEFVSLTQWLIRSDNHVDLFEFMLQKLLQRHLDSYFLGEAKNRVEHRSLNTLSRQLNVILSTIAGVGANSEQDLHASYKASIDLLEEYGVKGLSLLPPAECGLAKASEALEQIGAATPLIKKQVLMICGRAVVHDGKVTNQEAELIRAVADAIGCSVPPFAYMN